MKKIPFITILAFLFLTLPLNSLYAGPISDNDTNTRSANGPVRLAQADTRTASDNTNASGDDFMDDLSDLEEPRVTIADPFEPINRVFFHINDKLYYWLLKPAASGYAVVVPEPARRGIKNFFKNLTFPVRFVNCIFQGKFEGAGIEVDRFLINSTIGLAGFMDTAANQFNMKEYDEDLGQTLGSYGIGQGFFIFWPVLGPSSATDTIGMVGDAFLEPLYYLDIDTKYDAAVKAFETVNKTSLRLGEYEDFEKAALDPYIAFRDAYVQYRQNEIKN